MNRLIFILFVLIIAFADASAQTNTSNKLQQRFDQALDERHQRLMSIYNRPVEPSSVLSLHYLFSSSVRMQVHDQIISASGSIDDYLMLHRDLRLERCRSKTCVNLSIPGLSRATAISYSPLSGILACWKKGGELIRVFKLKDRDHSLIANSTTPVPVIMAHTSPDGSLLAAVGQDRSLMIGSPGRSLETAIKLPSMPLALGFSPFGGVLSSVDANGNVVTLRTSDNKPVDAYQLTGGPFEFAAFSGEFLVLTTKAGKRVVWNVPNKKQMGFADARVNDGDHQLITPLVVVTNETLVIDSGSPVLELETFQQRPELQAFHSLHESAVKILDVDGQVRYYGSNYGNPLPQVFAADWEPLEIDNGKISLTNLQSYVLYDTVARIKGLELVCRSLPGKGFWLWWRASTGVQQPLLPTGTLPVRNGFDNSAKPAHYRLD